MRSGVFTVSVIRNLRKAEENNFAMDGKKSSACLRDRGHEESNRGGDLIELAQRVLGLNKAGAVPMTSRNCSFSFMAHAASPPVLFPSRHQISVQALRRQLQHVWPRLRWPPWYLPLRYRRPEEEA
jgi:hypothetical protein